MNRFLSICFVLLATCPALAQSGTAIKQSGNVTPGHAWAVTTNGIAQDAGTAAIPYLTSIGTVGQGQTICAWSALSTAPGSQKICLGVTDAGGATITTQNFGTDTAQPLSFVINGTTYPFPFTSPGGILGPGTTVSGDIATWNNLVGTLLADTPPLQIFGTEAANKVLAGPATGSAAFPTFRTLVAADIPTNAPFAPVFNVTLPPYNAVCDGSTNASSGILSAITAAQTAGGATYFPDTGSACIGAVTVQNLLGVTLQADVTGPNIPSIKSTASSAITLNLNGNAGTGSIADTIVRNLRLESTGASSIALQIWNDQFFTLENVTAQAAGGSGSIGLNITGSGVGVLIDPQVYGFPAASFNSNAGANANTGPLAIVSGQYTAFSGAQPAMVFQGDILSVVSVATDYEAFGTTPSAITLDGQSSGIPVGSVTLVGPHGESNYNTSNNGSDIIIGGTHPFGHFGIEGGNAWGHGNGTNYQEYFLTVTAAQSVSVRDFIASALGNTHGYSGCVFNVSSSYTGKFDFRDNLFLAPGSGDSSTLYCGGLIPSTWTGDVTNNLQLDMGATTTSPGFYVALNADSVPRIRIGLNSTDVASLAMGPGSGNRDTFIERLGAANIRLGAPDAAAPVAQTLSMQNVVAGTSNTAGANFTINLSRGTGNARGGGFEIQATAAGSSGTSQNALANILDYNVTTPGNWTFTGTVIFNGAFQVTGAAAVDAGPLTLFGNQSVAAWTTSGVRFQALAASYTDTSSSGTIALAYTDLFGASTILASSATVYTNYYGSYFKDPIASTNVTFTHKYSLGADSINATAYSTGGTAGASCTLTTVSHLTVVAGIVTLCN